MNNSFSEQGQPSSSDDIHYEKEEEKRNIIGVSGSMSDSDDLNGKMEDFGKSEKGQHASSHLPSIRLESSRNRRKPRRRIVVTTNQLSSSSSSTPIHIGETMNVSSMNSEQENVTINHSNYFDGMKELGEQLDLLQKESSHDRVPIERLTTSRIGQYNDFRPDLSGDLLNSRNISAKNFEDHHISMLTEEVLRIYTQCLPPKEEEIRRQRFMNHLLKIIRSKWPDAQLELYGSAANQLGHHGADIDICLIFTKEPTDSRSKVLQELGRRLRSARMENVMVLKHARVPIVKFTDPVSTYSCDICYENRLAIHNTRLLKTYSLIDPRVRPLIFLVKYWARQRKINESSLGTLSR